MPQMNETKHLPPQEPDDIGGEDVRYYNMCNVADLLSVGNTNYGAPWDMT